MKLDSERPSSSLRSPVRRASVVIQTRIRRGYAPYGKPAPAEICDRERHVAIGTGVLLSGLSPVRESGLNKHLRHKPERVCIDSAFGVHSFRQRENCLRISFSPLPAGSSDALCSSKAAQNAVSLPIQECPARTDGQLPATVGLPVRFAEVWTECLSDQRTLFDVTVRPVRLQSLRYENRPDDRAANEQR